MLPGRTASSTAAGDEHPLVAELRKRFAADVIRREPIDRAAWLAKLRREAGGAGTDADA